MSSHREIAKIAGVSSATVSRALYRPDLVSPAAIKKVQDAIDQIGYRPNFMARTFRNIRTKNVILLVPDLTHSFYSNFIKGVSNSAFQRGYSILISATQGNPEREAEYAAKVDSNLADGVIQLRPYLKEEAPIFPDGMAWVNALGCENSSGPSVRIDNKAAAKAIVDYLISIGHKRIGVISGPLNNAHSQARYKGYLEAIREGGFVYDPSLTVYGDFSMTSGQRAAQTLCRMKDRPTAIFCMNDEMAIGAIQTLKSKQLKVPQDVSVVGFDNVNYAKYSDPPLTTIAQPAELMGNVAMEMLVDIIEGRTLGDSEQVLPWELIIRGSTMPPPRIF